MSGPGRNGRRPGEAKTPCTRDASLQPAAATHCPEGSPRPPLSRWTTPPGPEHVGRWGMGDDEWRGQTDGSVDLFYLTLTFTLHKIHTRYLLYHLGSLLAKFRFAAVISPVLGADKAKSNGLTFVLTLTLLVTFLRFFSFLKKCSLRVFDSPLGHLATAAGTFPLGALPLGRRPRSSTEKLLLGYCALNRMQY